MRPPPAESIEAGASYVAVSLNICLCACVTDGWIVPSGPLEDCFVRHLQHPIDELRIDLSEPYSGRVEVREC
jgi:hypothetical protein